MSGYAWYRASIHIPHGDKPTELLLAPIMSGACFLSGFSELCRPHADRGGSEDCRKKDGRPDGLGWKI